MRRSGTILIIVAGIDGVLETRPVDVRLVAPIGLASREAGEEKALVQ